MQTLNPLTIPLSSRQLIEASAGTGKTYTIALLYLRLLLEQGLNVDEILVVTFTTAATEELRSRVRSRIREALDVLEERSAEDQLLQAILDQANVSPDPHQHLTDALTRMDEAAIYTIHGFCQRMLQDHAFESGAPFEVEFLESEKPLRTTIIEDFWRLRFYPATASEAAWASKTWKDPTGLLQVLDGTLSRIDINLMPRVAGDTLEQLRQRCFSLFKQVQDSWPDVSEEIASLLESDTCLRRSATTYRKADRVPEILAAMNDLAGVAEMVWLLPDCLALLSALVMDTEKVCKKNCQPPSHPFFNLFADFFTAHQELLRLSRIHVVQEARTYLFSELDHRKREQSKMYFDDLLIRLDDALAGPRGGQLAARIRTRFPAALVDEFQDTDPLQYRIFKQIYAEGSGTLFMIGDPKQAIYSFRGADIFTYIQARRDTPEAARFTMDTNYRSTSPMVRAVNRLFSAPSPFIFERDIDFTPVNAHDKADEQPLLIDGSSPLPMTAMPLPETLAAKPGKPIAKDPAAKAAASCCARKIAGLITAGQQGRATMGDDPLTARHIAVLVRTHREADIMQQGLRRLGISSVYHSLDSVFSTEAARQLHQVLTAILNPGDVARIRNGLVTELFGLNGPALDNLRTNEQAWEEQLLTLQNYHRLWQDQGFAPMFQALLAGQRLVRRLSDRVGSERLLTDFLHLAELLAEAATVQPGMEGLLRWFTRQLQAPDPDAGNQQLRLESDENLVQIVTMHKAKGLEYPIVFLPFLWSVRQPQKDEPISFHDPENFRLIVDLGTEMQDHRERAQSERLAEDLRLLYVALTRARYCCYFCWGRISRMETSGLAYLLHRDDTGAIAVPTEEAIRKDLERLNDSEQLVAIDIYDETALPVHLKRETETVLSVKKFLGRIDTDWRITSYSGLASGHDPGPERPDYDRESVSAPILNSGRDIYSFPRGAAAGTCLHAILELLDFSIAGDMLEPVVRAQLETAGFDQAWTPVVCSWIDNILATRLNENLQLRLLDSRSRLNEMAFLFPLENLDINRFNRVLTSFAIGPLALTDNRLKGLMKGFIDLVFRFRGRYFLADYKSNFLGAGPQDYQPEKLAAAMREHRYDLQYLIYSLALHRFLKSRIADYEYDRHFGGVYYLFLRGMHPENEPGTGIFTVRPDRELIRRLDLCCQGQGGK